MFVSTQQFSMPAASGGQSRGDRKEELWCRCVSASAYDQQKTTAYLSKDQLDLIIENNKKTKMTSVIPSSSSSDLVIIPGQVIHCSSEQMYYNTLDAATKKNQLVVVDCFAEWCPPCRLIAPIFISLAEQHPNIIFVKIDVDKVPSIKSILSIWAMPTFVFIQNGQVVGSFMGADERKLRYGLENDGKVGTICGSLCNIL